MKYNLGILKTNTENSHAFWIKACESRRNTVNYSVIDFSKNDWLENSIDINFDCFLTCPSVNKTLFKLLYDERLYILNFVLKKKMYPTYEELLVYENKKMLAYWLKANRIPHPLTNVFYNKEDALTFADSCKYPIVGKTGLGSEGTGVNIILNKRKLEKYIGYAFSKKGIKRKGGPNFRINGYFARLNNRLKNIPESVRYFMQKFKDAHDDIQKGYVILQDYINCTFEWRVVKIGESYFAHKKLKSFGSKFSGTSLVSWDGPSLELLEFVKDVCDRRGFLCQAVDIFEPEPGRFYVNELHTFFGSRNPHQMILHEKPGRYINKNGNWIFEEGTFNSNNSFDLRLDHLIGILNAQNCID